MQTECLRTDHANQDKMGEFQIRQIETG